MRLADHDHGGSAIKCHFTPHYNDDVAVAYIDTDDDECDDDGCTRNHVYVLTDDEYDAINRWIRSSHYGDALDDLEPDDYIARALAEHHANRGGGATPGPAD